MVVGAGPTGVEIAGQIAEIARETLRRDFRAIDPREARILIVDRAERVLATFPASLSTKAEHALERLGITALLDRTVVGIDDAGVTLQPTAGAPERVPARTTIWAAGVGASPLAGMLADATGAGLDRTGRVTVEPDLSLPGHPQVLALGDMVRVRATDGEARALPGIAPVAMQQGRYAARLVGDRLQGAATPPFRYVDKGNLATIGRARAVVELRGLRLSGLPAWLTWLAIHLFYLIGFQNRLLVLTRWAISFLTRGRGARLIVQDERAAGSLTSLHAAHRSRPELQRAA